MKKVGLFLVMGFICMSIWAQLPETIGQDYLREAMYYKSENITFVNSDVLFRLTSFDKSAGLDYVKFSLNDSDFMLYRKPFQILQEGKHDITYKGFDNSGNIEMAKTFSVIVDNTSPTSSLETVKPLYVDGLVKYCSAKTKWFVEAKDRSNGSGVAAGYIGTDNKLMKIRGVGSKSEDSYFYLNAEGPANIYYTAIDNVGNMSPIKMLSVVADTTPPVVNLENNNKLINKDDTYTTFPSTDLVNKDNRIIISVNDAVSFSAKDELSGVHAIYIKINDGEYQKYIKSIKFVNNDIYNLEVKSVDNVGNMSQPVKYSFSVDKTNPISVLRLTDAEDNELNKSGEYVPPVHSQPKKHEKKPTDDYVEPEMNNADETIKNNTDNNSKLEIVGNYIQPITRESVQLKMDKAEFTPNDDGINDDAIFKVKNNGLKEKAKSWKINTFDSNGNLFNTIEGEGAPPNDVLWNGINQDGIKVKPNNIYRSRIKVLLKDGGTVSSSTNVKTGDFKSKTSVDLTTVTKEITPDGDGNNDKAVFNVQNKDLYGKAKSWTLLLSDPYGDVVNTISGNGEPPEKIEWDGLNENGKQPLSNSTYKADLIVKLKDGQEVSSSDKVQIGRLEKKETGKPKISFETTPKKFSPDGNGYNDKAVFGFNLNNLKNTAKSWNFSIFDPKGALVKKMSGSGAPPEKIEWDGLGDNGETVLSATSYTTIMEVALNDGKKLKATSELKTGILVEKKDDGTHVMKLSSFFFDPNKATFNTLSADKIKSNQECLEAVVETINNYPEYNISIEGHANNTSGTEEENINYLIPLSQERADAIAIELNKRGISFERMSTVGMGGNVPVVPRKNKAEWWKNRRVEFVLKKK